MERRALIAVVISLAILILYQELVIKHFYPLPSEAPATPAAETGPPSQGPAATKPTAEAGPPLAEREKGPAPAVEPGAAAPPTAEVAAVKGRDVIVDTDLYRAVFTTAGARLKSLQLKRYRTTVDENSPPLQLVLEPVQSDLPLGVDLRGKQVLNDRGVLYRADHDHINVHGSQVATVTFTGETDGATIQKSFQVRGDSYLFGCDIKAANVPPAYTEMAIAWHEGAPQEAHRAREVLFDNVVVLQGPKLRRHAFAKLDKGEVLEDDIEWVAFSGRYFLAAMVPRVDAENYLRVWMKKRETSVETQLLLAPGTFDVGLDLYLGPKNASVLDRVGHQLRRAVDLGWFTFIALPLLQVLHLFHHVTGNYGIDIILLTVLIKILFVPLTQKSLTSMREMQKLQPQMTAIRERYKDKPDQMNKEIMELYRRHKVNPLGGCLPMVLQIPVFIGLYEGLLNAVELRHAPFFLWINDLSAPDRLGTVKLPYVTPAGFPVLTLLMGVSMFLQQWMTPSTGDPTQQRVMLIMPVVFTFMFINFPSGLSLYWLVNNILTIAQTYVINKKSGK
jgi:YidC/Oxa1 family membrane protein insertase